MIPPGSPLLAKTTSPQVVLPFYLYAALSFLAATLMLFGSSSAFTGHYFQPSILAITHAMALGWATMITLGASHQLVPVLIEGKLYSERLARLCFALAAMGIPLLVYGLHTFHLGWPTLSGGLLVVSAIVVFVVNIGMSMWQSKRRHIHALFVLTAVLWLLFTVCLGLLLAYNLTQPILGIGSLHYLPIHAHAGIIGWFLLMVLGVGSRLIPLFLISKYSNPKLLWVIYWLVNAGLIGYMQLFALEASQDMLVLAALPLAAGLALFVWYCTKAYQERLRRRIDGPMRLSLVAVAMLAIPLLLLLATVLWLALAQGHNTSLVLGYGFSVFFGWLTAIIMGMTFKTLPFIVWNKAYHHRAGKGQTPNPKDLFSYPVFVAMGIAYLLGFVLFGIGILGQIMVLLQVGAALLIACSILYNFNVIKLITHKAPTA